MIEDCVKEYDDSQVVVLMFYKEDVEMGFKYASFTSHRLYRQAMKLSNNKEKTMKLSRERESS
jgi:hypothetical protein